MNGRKRILAHISGQQPARRWILDESRSGTVRDVWERGDGYKVEVYFTAAGVVRWADLTSPGGQRRCLHEWQNGKADFVIAWLTSPASYFGPEVSVS